MTPLPHEIPPQAHAAPALTAAIPVLTGPRVTLRAPQIADFPALYSIGSGDRGAGIGGPFTREDMWFDFAQMTATWIWRGHGYWSVEADGKLIGFTGIGFEPGDQEPELGYMLTEEAEGQGYAREAAGLSLDHARKLKLPSLVSYIFATNTGSIAVAKALGAIRDTAAEGPVGHEGIVVYRHNMGATQ